MAARESTTQPIICCIGASVAGQPTQFLLERAFDHLRLPWRALTVEFDAANFAQVCEAMLAMGFQGLRFYGDFEKLAVKLLAPVDSASQFIGQATSALKSGNQWSLWNNLGFSWLDLLKHHQATAVWLHGDSVENRSLLIALLQGSINWIWTNAPSAARDAVEVAVDASLKPIIQARVFDSASPPQAKQLRELLGMEVNTTEPNAATTALSSTQRLAIISREPSLPKDFTSWLLEHSPEMICSSHLKLTDELAGRCVCDINASDIAVAAEASDFKRWTGQSIDSSILRDAYDEFCDF